jgi:hypothetical protein
LDGARIAWLDTPQQKLTLNMVVSVRRTLFPAGTGVVKTVIEEELE